RMGALFLNEGEPASAQEFFEKALEANPRGACRARQGLARIALAMDDPTRSLILAEESIRVGNYAAKTIAAWPILIAARRKLGGWQISQNLLDGLEMAPPSVRARAVLAITRELRNSDMRQWREVALRWSGREGQEFPIVEAEIRKMVLASAKVMPGDATGKRELAEQLLQTPGLSRNEWLAAAKEVVRAGLWEGRTPDLDGLIRYADTQYGEDSGPRATHSLALSCMMAKRHDLARPLLQRNITQLPAGKSMWGKSIWALARMESFLGNHSAAAGLYRQFFEAESIPVRFRLQAQLLWAQALITAGHPDALLEARPRIEAFIAEVKDSDLLLDFARQIPAASPELSDWRNALFERGATWALQKFQEANHPSVAADILFKLTRRQVYDFDRADDAILFWESLSQEKKQWLWAVRTSFWAYLGWVLEAYHRKGHSQQGDAFAYSWLDDPATPPEGRVQVGIPYGRWLIESGRTVEALDLFTQLIQEAPTHPLSAHAWYWKALEAHKRGEKKERNRCCACLRQAQGVTVGLLGEWSLDAKALLLLADLRLDQIDAQAVNYLTDFLQMLRDEIQRDMGRLS
ncbi:MAG: hypothetical protein KKC51_02745, partial [Verrucomicrobia bacterium]|nr:hypothetical protein [Verrucomicrobiota bacterium]